MSENLLILVAMFFTAAIILNVCLFCGIPLIFSIQISILGFSIGYWGMVKYLDKLRIIE